MSLKTKPLSDAEYLALADFRHGLRRFLEFSAKAATAEGLTSQQHQALLAIRGNEEATASVGRLAERLCLRHNTTVELAQRLESAGFIARRASEEDRRSVVLSLTAEGEAKLEILSQTHRRELRQIGAEMRTFFKKLGEEEQQP